MPLRVAEVNGWIKGVNQCDKCPFATRNSEEFWICENRDIRMTGNEFKPLSIGFIPAWCPLPEPGIVSVKPSDKFAKGHLSFLCGDCGEVTGKSNKYSVMRLEMNNHTDSAIAHVCGLCEKCADKIINKLTL